MLRQVLARVKQSIKRTPILGSFAIKVKRSRSYHASSAPLRACHYEQLYVNSKGDVFPCCWVWGRGDEVKIGNLRDEDLARKIRTWKAPYCDCKIARLRSANDGEAPSYDFLNLEVSLACNARCAMCCVDAPSWRGKYDEYARLTDLIAQTSPGKIVVQGGEVLIQPRSMQWLREIRKAYPQMTIAVVTNGSVTASHYDVVDEVFSSITVSLVGFQPETYKIIMGLDISTAKAFSESMIQRGKRVALKFVATPSNVHEVVAFLRWAIPLRPHLIHLTDTGTTLYVKMDTKDSYWEKILQRTIAAMKDELTAQKEVLLGSGTAVAFSPGGVFEENKVPEFCSQLGVPELAEWNG